MAENALEELDGILDAERAALLTGDLEKVNRLIELKERLVERCKADEFSDLQKVEIASRKLARNQELLDQARAGIRSVAERLAVLKRVQETLDTYDANGKKRTVQTVGQISFEKRA